MNQLYAKHSSKLPNVKNIKIPISTLLKVDFSIKKLPTRAMTDAHNLNRLLSAEKLIKNITALTKNRMVDTINFVVAFIFYYDLIIFQFLTKNLNEQLS